MSPTIFKAYDIRGVYPTELNEDICRRIGNAFVAFTGADRVLVGWDMRVSSPALAAAFIEGAVLAGVDVVELGLVSTDECWFASGKYLAPAAMFTASHNPPQYGGIKLCREGAAPIGEETGLRQIQAQVAEGVLMRGEDPGTVTKLDVLEAFGAHVRSFVNLEELRPLRVVADTANGMGGLVVPSVFEGLPFELEVLYPELDGTFPNHPADPIQVENLKDLQAAVLASGADVGLAFDGDADRVFLVDDQAIPVSGSTTTALVARAMLEGNAGANVVHNLICSKAVPAVITANGGVPIRTRVGHSFIKQVMAETNAIFGGEHSGHYYFRDNFRADSGLIAAMVVLHLLSVSGKKLSELRAEVEVGAASGEINMTVEDPVSIMAAVQAAYADAEVDLLDGLTVDCGDWWFNLRPSNTEPLLRLNLEAPDSAAVDARVAEVREMIKQVTA